MIFLRKAFSRQFVLARKILALFRNFFCLSSISINASTLLISIDIPIASHVVEYHLSKQAAIGQGT